MDVFKISVPNNIVVGTFDNTTTFKTKLLTCATLDGREACCVSVLLVMFLRVLAAGFQPPMTSDLSTPRGTPVLTSRASGGPKPPGTGGTFAQRLIKPVSLPGCSRRLAGPGCGTSAGVQFRLRSSFSGDESSESSNINSDLRSCFDEGERQCLPTGEASRDDVGLDRWLWAERLSL